jgi:hypothetical protein
VIEHISDESSIPLQLANFARVTSDKRVPVRVMVHVRPAHGADARVPVMGHVPPYPAWRGDCVIIDQKDDLAVCGVETRIFCRDDSRIPLMDYFETKGCSPSEVLSQFLSFDIVALPYHDNFVRKYLLGC